MSATPHCSSYMKLYFTASAFTGKTTVFNSFLLVKTRGRDLSLYRPEVLKNIPQDFFVGLVFVEIQ
jgi:hypothetical protein